MAGGRGAGKMCSFNRKVFSKGKKRHFPSNGEEEPMRKMPKSEFAPRSRIKSVHFVSAGHVGGSGEYVGGTGADEEENGRQGLGCSEQDDLGDEGAGVSSQPHPLDRDALLKKQKLVASLSSVLSATLLDPQYATGTDAPNYSLMLSRGIQACKTTPHYIYVNLKDIPQDNLPEDRKVPTDGYACELRCQGVYLATGYSCSKKGARDHASENAVKLLTKPVEVRVVTRRMEDVVVCKANCPTPSLAPALWNPDNAAHLAVTDNVQDQMVAEAAGSKKTSNHEAATEMLAKLRASQAGQRQALSDARDAQPPDLPGVKKKDLSKLIIVENSNNALSILRETGQFNMVTVDYKFTRLTQDNWKCQVYLGGQCKGCIEGPKKLIKHMAAQEALDTLRQTQAVVKTNLPKEDPGDAISRKQILGSRLADATHEIKEDNIGNQLLRKMGWMGGGLGRHRDGITEPIRVKELRFSRKGFGLDATKGRLSKRDIEDIILKYAASEQQDELCFSADLTKEERKNIHLFCTRNHLRSNSYGQGTKRHLVVSRKVDADQLIGQLLQEGQVGRYKLIKPQPSQ
ncbi:NF-kappa-B-repressing factor-like [Stigmatopora argus]